MGYAVAVPDLRASLRQEPCLSAYIAATVAAIDRAPSGPAVLIGHSRSGPLLPAVAAGCRQRPMAILFVDSALPYPGRSWADEAPPERVAAMRRKVTGSRLPRWSDWWDDPSVIEGAIPQPTVRARFIDELPQVPSGFLDERLPDLDWHGKAGYLQLSAAYAAFADTARDSGWPVETRNLDHLAIVTAPIEVASAISTLLNDLAQTAGQRRSGA
jgi:hypothetical protein